jgi:hypothetical protein
MFALDALSAALPSDGARVAALLHARDMVGLTAMDFMRAAGCTEYVQRLDDDVARWQLEAGVVPSAETPVLGSTRAERDAPLAAAAPSTMSVPIDASGGAVLPLRVGSSGWREFSGDEDPWDLDVSWGAGVVAMWTGDVPCRVVV